MKSPIYRIINWDQIYEWESTRDRPQEPMKWVKVPTKQGSGYRALVGHKHGASHLGGWVALQQVAAQCFPRGILINRDGAGLTNAVLATKTLLPEALFNELMPRLVDPKDVGWIEEISLAEVRDLLEALRTRTHTRVQVSSKRSITNVVNRPTDKPKDIQKKLPTDVGSAKSSAADKSRSRQPIRPVDDVYLDELQADMAYKHLNVRVCYAQMVQWCKSRTPPKIPSRRRLIAWLNREERPMETGHDPTPPASGQRQSAAERRSSTLRGRNYDDIAERSAAYDRPRQGKGEKT